LSEPEPARDTARAPSAREHAFALALCLLLLTGVCELWRADFTVPFWDRFDAMFTLVLVKGGIDAGSYFVNPLLGAPFQLEMYDHPVGAMLHFAWLKLITLVTRNAPLAINLYFLLGFPLATASSLEALRRMGLAPLPSLIAALLYTFLPYHLIRGETHLFLAGYYVVPLAVLVLFWQARGELALARRPSRRTLAAAGLLALVASANVYYAFFTAVLLGVRGAFEALRRRQFRPLALSGALVAVLVAAFAANIAPNLVHFAAHGRNPGGADRRVVEAQIHGLRPGALVLPMPEHRVAAWRAVRRNYDQDKASLEDAAASLGAVASVGFVALLVALLCRRAGALTRFLAESNFVLLLLGSMGGFGSLFALFVSPLFRAYARVSIFIGFLALTAVARGFELLAPRLQARFVRLPELAAAALLVLGILDQTSGRLVPDYRALAAAYRDDRRLLRAFESTAPEGTALFTLPYVAFPEATEGIAGNDLLRGYLHTQRSRFSAGAMNGSYAALWQEGVARQPVNELVRTLSLAGFGAVYVDRRGDLADGLESGLTSELGAPLTNERGDLAIYPLTRAIEAVRGSERWARRARTLERVVPVWSGFFDEEYNRTDRWRWSSGAATLHLLNPASVAQRVRVEFAIYSAPRAGMELAIRGLYTQDLRLTEASQKVELAGEVPPGWSTLSFAPKGAPILVNSRPLAFAIRGFSVEPSE
jgi:phosphoglycerol transferase